MTFPLLPSVNDESIYDIWFTRYKLPALAVAVKLNIFQMINHGANSIQLLSAQLQFDPKGISALCTFLAALGFLEKTKDIVRLTPTSQTYFLPDSPYFWGAALSRVHETTYYIELHDAITKRGYLLAASGKTFTDMWETGSITLDAAEKFTAIMQSTIFYAAVAATRVDIFNGIKCLLDVGAGSGCFAAAFVSYYQKSSAIAFEIPVVSGITEQYLRQFDVDDKVKIIQGNFFTDSLPKADGVLFSNILHDWLPEQVDMLLKKAYDALEENGRIIIHEMLLNEEKNGPVAASAFNLLMYINHRSQQFTFQELSVKLSAIGFKNISLRQHHPCYSLVIGYK